MLCIRGTSHGPVSVSVCHKSVFYQTSERIELVFGTWASFHPSYTVLKEIRLFPKIRTLTSLWNFVLNSGVRKFRHGISIVETCYRLSSRKVDAQSVINWTVVCQLSRWYLRAPTLDRCSLSHRSSSAVYSMILSHRSISDSWYLLDSWLVVQVVSALLRGSWQDFNWHDASRGPSAIAELLVFSRCACAYIVKADL